MVNLLLDLVQPHLLSKVVLSCNPQSKLFAAEEELLNPFFTGRIPKNARIFHQSNSITTAGYGATAGKR